MWWICVSTAMASFGSIAVAPDGSVGASKDRPTKADAERQALASCGRPDCRVEINIEGQYCASVAEGAGGLVSWAWGPEQQQTRDWAMERCQQNARGCVSRQTVCNKRFSDWGHRWRKGDAPVRPPSPAPVQPRPIGAETIRACEAAFDGDPNEQACLQAVRGAFDPSGLIRACEAAFDGDPNELDCVRSGSVATRSVAGDIRACESAFDGDANELLCVQAAVRSAVDATASIQECERSRDGDAAELECVRLVLGLQ